MVDVLCVLAAFSTGLLVGVVWAEPIRATILRGHTALMAAADPTADSPARRRPWLAYGLLLALIANAVSVVISLSSSSTSNDTRGDLAAAVACIVQYNEADGAARDELSRRAAEQTDASLSFYTKLRAAVTAGDVGTGQLLPVLDEQIAALEATRRTRQNNPYPAPDLCAMTRIGQDGNP